MKSIRIFVALLACVGCTWRSRNKTANAANLLRGGLMAANLIAIVAMGGCVNASGFSDDPLRPDAASIKSLKDQYWSTEIENCYRERKCTTPKLDSAESIRDYIVLGRMHVYRIEFSLLVRSLSGGNNIISVGSDLTALLLNGIGATTGSAATKAALAAASGGVLAANGAVDKDLFYSKTVPAIITQMEANRASAEATIFNGLKLHDDQYDLGRATRDLDILNNAGSLSDAVSSITQKATDEKKTAQTEDWTAPFRDTKDCETADCKAIRAWLLKADSNIKDFNNWCKENVPEKYLNGIPATEAVADTPGEVFDVLRSQVIKKLSIH